jgi:septal ring factor EnvC (AmiA/AmiB activator)
MKAFLWCLGIIALAVWAVLPNELFAQETSRDRLRERVETVIIGKFSSELDLSPEQAEKFFPRLQQYQHFMEETQSEQRQIRDRLDELSLQEDSSPEEVAQLLDRLSENQQRMVEAKRSFLEEVSPFISPQQVSRCSILMDEIPQRVREMIRERQGRVGGESLAPPPHRPPAQRGRRR